MQPLPHCDELFSKFFLPWYGDMDLTRRWFAATYPDTLRHKQFLGPTQSKASPLTKEGQEDALERIVIITDSAKGDWPSYLPVSGEMDLNWIDAFDRYYDRNQIQKVIDSSDPKDFNNGYLVTCCEFGAVLGYVLCKSMSRLFWRFDWPFCDSCLIDPKSGTALPVFHWAVKKMSEYGVDDGFAAKVKACLQLLDRDFKR